MKSPLRIKLKARIGQSINGGLSLEYRPDGVTLGVSPKGIPWVEIDFDSNITWAMFDLEEMEKALEQIRRTTEELRAGRTDGRAEEGGNQVNTTDQG